MHPVRLGIYTDGGVLRLQEGADHLVQMALADARRLECARDDDVADSQSGQAGCHLHLPHALQLGGGAGHGHDDRAVLLHPPAGGRTAGVGDGLGGGDEHRLLDVALGEAEAASGEEGAQPLLRLRIHVHLLAQGEGDRLTRQVVLGGAEAAGDEDEVGPLAGAADGLGQAAQVVAHLGDVVQVDAQRGQAGGQVLGVGVQYIAEEDLGAHGDDLRLHGTRIGGQRMRVKEGGACRYARALKVRLSAGTCAARLTKPPTSVGGLGLHNS